MMLEFLQWHQLDVKSRTVNRDQNGKVVFSDSSASSSRRRSPSPGRGFVCA